MSLRETYRKLPARLRPRLLHLLHTGVPDDAVLSDPEIAEALRMKGIRMNAADLALIRRSADFLRYEEKASEDRQSREAEQITSSALDEAGDLGEITDAARYELAKLVRTLIRDAAGDPETAERIRAVRSLSQSLASLARPALEKRLAEKDEALAALREELHVREQELLRLKEQAKEWGAGQVIDVLNRKTGIL